MLLVSFAVSLVLIVGAYPIASLLVRGLPNDSVGTPANSRAVARVAFMLAGIFLAVQTIPALLRTVAGQQPVLGSSVLNLPIDMIATEWMYVLGLFIQFAIGLLIVTFSRRLAARCFDQDSR